MSFRLIATPVKFAIRAIFLLSLSGLAIAEDEAKIIARVVGEITVNANGSVKAVSLTNVKVAKFNQFLTDKVKTWTFYPMEINGKPVESVNEFSFNVIATVESDDMLKKIQLSNVRIEISTLEAEINKKRGLIPSRKPHIYYPLDPMNVGAEATVVLAIEVAADGKVRKAELSDIELLNTNRKKTEAFSRYFAKSAINGVLKKQWTLAELAAYNCINGCVSFYYVNFVMDGSGFWKAYQHVPQAPIPWVIASELKDMDDSEKSQLVRLKDDPTGKPIDMGG